MIPAVPAIVPGCVWYDGADACPPARSQPLSVSWTSCFAMRKSSQPNRSRPMKNFTSRPTAVATIRSRNDWSLSIKGLVERPVTLTYEQLRAEPMVSQIVTLECVGNTVAGEFLSTAEWDGISLRALLEEAGACPLTMSFFAPPTDIRTAFVLIAPWPAM